MMTKKNWIIAAVAIVIIICGAVIWRGGFLGGNAGMGAQNSGQPAGSLSRMNDDVFVEITAQMVNSGADPSSQAYDNQLQTLLDKYGVTKTMLGSYAQAINGNKAHSDLISQKIFQRLSDLQKTGGK